MRISRETNALDRAALGRHYSANRIIRMTLADYPVSEKQLKRQEKFVRDYAKTSNWPGVCRVIGGSPRYDLQDLTDADHGEAPAGAEW